MRLSVARAEGEHLHGARIVQDARDPYSALGSGLDLDRLQPAVTNRHRAGTGARLAIDVEDDEREIGSAALFEDRRPVEIEHHSGVLGTAPMPEVVDGQTGPAGSSEPGTQENEAGDREQANQETGVAEGS